MRSCRAKGAACLPGLCPGVVFQFERNNLITSRAPVPSLSSVVWLVKGPCLPPSTLGNVIRAWHRRRVSGKPGYTGGTEDISAVGKTRFGAPSTRSLVGELTCPLRGSDGRIHDWHPNRSRTLSSHLHGRFHSPTKS